VFSYSDVLPLADYFDVLDRRFDARLSLARSYSALNDRAYQLRIVQKRLLTRFKNKNATPIAGLDILFHETYSQVMACADAVKHDQDAVEATAQRLSAATALLTFLMALSFDMDADDAKALSWYWPKEIG
jgi:Bardet-Biedl syndrome 9 protein